MRLVCELDVALMLSGNDLAAIWTNHFGKSTAVVQKYDLGVRLAGVIHTRRLCWLRIDSGTTALGGCGVNSELMPLFC
jgi:hypothetical protein